MLPERVTSPEPTSQELATRELATAHIDPERSEDGAWLVEVPLRPTAHLFPAGHRVRVQVSSGAFPRYARNSGSGELAVNDAELHITHQEILHGAGRASSVTLPFWSK